MTITANGTFSKDIEPGATVFLQVKYGLITLIKQEADLCDNLPKIDITCPLKEGVLSLQKEVDIPQQVVGSIQLDACVRSGLTSCLATREVHRSRRRQHGR